MRTLEELINRDDPAIPLVRTSDGGQVLPFASTLSKKQDLTPFFALPKNEQSSMKSRSWIVGLSFAGFHAALILIFLAVEGFALGGEARLLWVLWLPLDFPVSMLVGLGFDHLPTSNNFFRALRTWWPQLVHGIFGTVWWFVVPFIVVRFIESRRRKTKKEEKGQWH